MITPAIYLEAGKNYQVSVQLRGRNAERKMEIMAGQEATVEGMTIRVTGVETFFRKGTAQKPPALCFGMDEESKETVDEIQIELLYYLCKRKH